MGRYAERRKAKGESNGFLHLPLSARQLVRALSAKTYTARCCFSMCMLFMRPFTFTSCIRFMSSINFGVIATPGAGGKTSSIAVPTVSPPSRALHLQTFFCCIFILTNAKALIKNLHNFFSGGSAHAVFLLVSQSFLEDILGGWRVGLANSSPVLNFEEERGRAPD